MSELNLTKDILIDMLGDAEFYEKCPHFLHMKDQGLACYNAYIQRTGASDCTKCGSYAAATPALIELVRHIKKLKDVDAGILEPVKDYIGSRRPKRPDTVHIRHKYDGKPEVLTF